MARIDFSDRSKVLAIIGQGYVGLPLAMSAVDAGWSVIGIEKSVSRVEHLNSGSSPVEDISNSRLASAIKANKYVASNNPSDVSSASVVTICVPTPLNEAREPDLELLESATKDVAPFLSNKTLLVSESTSYPGTLREVIIPLVNKLKPKSR
jgi:nucleotide sugar dehydrogenase